MNAVRRWLLWFNAPWDYEDGYGLSADDMLRGWWCAVLGTFFGVLFMLPFVLLWRLL